VRRLDVHNVDGFDKVLSGKLIRDCGEQCHSVSGDHSWYTRKHE
jgi:hypothetical protein